MPVQYEMNRGHVPVKVWAPSHEVEAAALDQLANVSRLPWVFHHVAVMPDVHSGKGCTVGSVIATKNALSPATVGVDIGCGVTAVKTSLTADDLPDNLEQLRSEIEAAIPVGFSSHEGRANLIYQPDLSRNRELLMNGFHALDQSVSRRTGMDHKAESQLGTLGGGNHFIELCLDEGSTPRVWLVLHSGSRNVGKELAEVHIARARVLTHNADLPDPDLAAFLTGTPEMEAYRRDLTWAQQYARLNREIMVGLCKGILWERWPRAIFGKQISCHHNYVSEEVHFGEEVFVTRKGAVSARDGEMAVIPGSMGTATYVVRGLGNPESFCSASHGAGRRMSRGQAKRTFTVGDLAAQTMGVCCRKDQGVVDEIPGAYKSIDQVMENQSDLVEVVAKLKQVICVKG